MDVGQKSTLGLGYDARVLVPARQSIRGGSFLPTLMVLFALSVGVAIASPSVPMTSPWLVAAMLIASVATLPVARDILVAGSGPSAAIVSAILGNEPGRRVVYQATNVSDASHILDSTAIRKVIVADNVDAKAISGLSDLRGIRPSIMDATDAVGDLLGRLPVQLVDARTIRYAVEDQSVAFRFVKRTVDLAFSLSLGLLILPIIPLAALAIRIDSPGSIFYSQERVGLNGKLFRIYKFRSMRQDAEKHGAVWAKAGDARVTRVGRFIRLTRIDELPQLWNVLRGDMTLVGPRPERPEFTSMLEQEIPGYGLRTKVKPGLTGWAQVSYRYTNSVAETRTKVEYDLYYVKFASIGLDLRILFRTVAVVIKMRGC